MLRISQDWFSTSVAKSEGDGTTIPEALGELICSWAWVSYPGKIGIKKAAKATATTLE
jgi:hypothetical protein